MWHWFKRVISNQAETITAVKFSKVGIQRDTNAPLVC